MEGKYTIFYRGKQIGQVLVDREGLYYHFRCKCKFEEDAVCKLMYQYNNDSYVLGIMVPEADVFVMEKRIAIKHFEEGTPYFFIPWDTASERGMFVPISPDEPFGYLAKLTDAFLSYKNGRIGAWIPKK